MAKSEQELRTRTRCETQIFAPKGQPHISPGQSESASAAERRPGLRAHHKRKP